MPAFIQSLAVVVGIDAYTNGVPPLQSARADAERLASVLEDDHGYRVIKLLDEAATRAQLMELMTKTLPADLTANDRLLFYYAGHGVALDGDDGPKGYLLPQDAQHGDESTYLHMPWLHDALLKLTCRHALVILDACFGGAFRWSATRDVRRLPKVIHQERYDRFILDPAWQVITSAAHDQTALDSLSAGSLSMRPGEGQHSPFALALFDALAGAGDVVPADEKDGVITATELYLYLESVLQPETIDQRHRQTPRLWPLGKHDKGEYIFLVPGHELNLPPAPPLSEANNPYRGLESYDEDEADLFFGRTEVIKELVAQVAAHPLTAALGASGTGKSSVVKAGLLPALRKVGGYHVLDPVRPGTEPDQVLDLATAGLAKGEDAAARIAVWCKAHPEEQLVLTIDQLEELTTLAADAGTRDQVLAQVEELLQAHPEQLRVVITLRTDFEPPFAASVLKETWAAGRYVVRPMTQAELREVIEQPASRRVLYFKPPELVDELINQVVAMPGGLPLLSFALSEMYLHYLGRSSDDRAIERVDYEAVGGVVGAIRTKAEAFYTGSDHGLQAVIRQVMLRMVSVEGGELTRRRIYRDELDYESEVENERLDLVVTHLVEARLLVEGLTADQREYVEPAHDALVTAWERLIQWVHQENRRGFDDLRFQHSLAQAAARWEEEKDDMKARTGLLWRDPARSAVLSQLLKQQAPWMNRRERFFAKRSVRSRRRIRIVLGGTVVFMTLLAIAAVMAANRAVNSARDANLQSLVAQATALGSLARQEPDPEVQLLLTTQALNLTQEAETLVEARPGTYRNGFVDAPFLQLFDGAQYRHSLVGYQGPTGWMRQGANAVARSQMSARGSWLVTGNSLLGAPFDSTSCCVHLWNLAHPSPSISTLPLPNLIVGGYEPLRVAFSGDEQWMASAHTDRTTRLWQLDPSAETQVPLLSLEQTNETRNLAFSPDHRVLATTDSLAVLLDLESHALDTLAGTADLIAFSPDNAWLATAARDGTVRLWARPHQPGAAPVHVRGLAENPVALRFSPESRWLTIATLDYRLLLWDLADATRPVYTLPHQELAGGLWDPYTYPARFGPNEQHLITVYEGEHQLFAIEDGVPQTRPSSLFSSFSIWGGKKPVFSSDGQRLITMRTGTADTTWVVDLRRREVWSIPAASLYDPHTDSLLVHDAGTNTVWRVPIHRNGPASSLSGVLGVPQALSPDGRWLLTRDEVPDRAPQLLVWDLYRLPSTPEVLPWFLVERAAQFDPESRWLMLHNAFATQLVDLEALAASTELAAPRAGHQPLLLSEDRRWLLTQARGARTVSLWDVHSPEHAPLVLDGFVYPNQEDLQEARLVLSPDLRWVVLVLRWWGGQERGLMWERQADSAAVFAWQDQAYALAFSAESRYLLSDRGNPDGNTRTGTLWDLSGGVPERIRAFDSSRSYWRFAADRAAIEHHDTDSTVMGVFLDDLDTTYREPRLVPPTEEAITSPDGRWQGGRHVVEGLEDLQAGGEEPTYFTIPSPSESGRLFGVHSFSMDSRWVFVVDSQSNEMAICDLVQLENPLRCSLLDGAVVGSGGIAIMSPKGQWMATHTTFGACDWDEGYRYQDPRPPSWALQLWNLHAPNPSATPTLLPNLCPLAFSEDGGWLYTYAPDTERIQRWPLDTDTMRTYACAALGRNMTGREWAQYMGAAPYQCTCPVFPSAEGTFQTACPNPSSEEEP